MDGRENNNIRLSHAGLVQPHSPDRRELGVRRSRLRHPPLQARCRWVRDRHLVYHHARPTRVISGAMPMSRANADGTAAPSGIVTTS